MKSKNKTTLDFELSAAKEVYNYIMDRSMHIIDINAEVFATRCIDAGFGPLVTSLVKKNIPKVDITDVVDAQIKKGLRK